MTRTIMSEKVKSGAHAYTGKVKIGNKVYDCEVVDGVRYIDGVTVTEFLERLPFEEQFKFAMTGYAVKECEKNETPVSAGKLYESLGKKPN